MLDEDGNYGEKHGVETESEYPYLTRVLRNFIFYSKFNHNFWQDDKCHYNKTKVVANISNWYFSAWYNSVHPNDEQQMKQDVATIGPVAACINVT